jgi:hypothetical protein
METIALWGVCEWLGLTWRHGHTENDAGFMVVYDHAESL